MTMEALWHLPWNYNLVEHLGLGSECVVTLMGLLYPLNRSRVVGFRLKLRELFRPFK